MREQRENDKHLLLVDAGDLLFKKYSGPLSQNDVSALTQKARLIIESFNLMAYDAVGIGDDDLSLGKEFLVETLKKAAFPVLSSNLVDEESGKLLFKPYAIKEVNGLRIGIFSLLSPEVFLGPADPRRKGITLRPPMEVAQAMVKELQPKTDLIVLLSHLGYPKDMELAQTMSGIHLIVGSHTGMNLTFPPVVRNSVILQSGSKGMYAGRFELLLAGSDLSFSNTMTKRSYESNLANIKNQLIAPNTPEVSKVRLRKNQEDLEKKLREMKGKNEFNNVLLAITDQMKDNPDVLKMVEEYKSRFPEHEPAPPVEPPAAGPAPGPKGGGVPKK